MLDDELKKKAYHVLEVELADNVKARVMDAEGNYEKLDRRGKEKVNSQLVFCEEAKAAAPKPHAERSERVFIPAEPAE